jgi:hypothetical protein
MKSFFDPCVNKIVELLDGQIARVEREERMDVKASSNQVVFRI